MAYPQPSDFMSAAPLSAWVGRGSQVCAATGWDALRDLQDALSERLSDESAPLPSYDGLEVTADQVPNNELAEPPVGWNTATLRALWAACARDRASAAYLDAIRADAQQGAGAVSPRTLAAGVWQAEFSRGFSSDGTPVYGQGSPDDVSVPNGASLPRIDAAPPRPSSGAASSGLQCGVASQAGGGVTPIDRNAQPFRFSPALVLGLFAAAAAVVIVVSSRVPTQPRAASSARRSR